MDEYDEIYYHAAPQPIEPSKERTFSLAGLLGLMTLSAMGLAWGKLVAIVAPLQVLLLIASGFLVLGVIVGYRRSGTLPARLRATILFFLGGLAIAFYSACIAEVVQQAARRSTYRFHEPSLAAGVVAFFAFPIVCCILFFMLRAWVWSAHDSRLRSSSDFNRVGPTSRK